MTKWLSIVGIGEDGLDALSPSARALVETAQVLVGGARHLAMLPDDGRERHCWTRPLSKLVDTVMARKQRNVCVLATGDPMCYGIGVTFARHVPAEEMTIIPAPSAFELACSRLGWSRAEVETLTLHGRPLELLNLYLAPGARLLILSHDGSTPAHVAAALSARGYGDSRLIVLEHMGGAKEGRVEGIARDWPARPLADLNTLAVTCVADSGTLAWPRVPGLPDDAFANDGQLTKREVRAATLAALAPLAGECLWDVGAGAGSVAIEWMRCSARATAIAIERKPARCRLIADNAAALGTPSLEIVSGEAPAALTGLAAPDAVFLGGGLTQNGVFEACWRALRPGGRLVANAVTVEGEHKLLAWHGEVGGELVRIAIARAVPVGRFTGWRPLMPVTQFTVRKP